MTKSSFDTPSPCLPAQPTARRPTMQTPLQPGPKVIFCVRGAVSPLLSNIYLDPLDHLMAERGFEMVRYADDFVVMCRNQEDAAAALALVQEWTASAGLTLHPTKTRLVDERKDGFDFLGYHFEAGKRWPRSKSRKKLRDTIRAKTKRTSRRSMPVLSKVSPLTGEPDAGDPHVRFGGRGIEANRYSLPLSSPYEEDGPAGQARG